MAIIFHIDMNAFFASVEEVIHPEYKNQPLVVAGKTRRSIVGAANYIARSYGVHAAMPLFQALEICPKLINVPNHMATYIEFSEKFINVITTEFTDKIEIASIDECYLDATEMVSEYHNNPIFLAQDIQKKIQEKIGIGTSIGISTNKFLAKMASDMKKPMGVTELYIDDIKTKLWPLDIKNMMMIGKKTEPKLRNLGINTIGEIANFSDQRVLEHLFGILYIRHYNNVWGLGIDTLDYSKNKPKSIGNSRTFLYDTDDYDEIKKMIYELSKYICGRLSKHQLVAKTINITLKDEKQKSHNKQKKVNKYLFDFSDIFEEAMLLFDFYWNRKPIRLVGVSLSNLEEIEAVKIQISLFENTNLIESKDLSLIKDLNERFSKDVISYGKINPIKKPRYEKN